MGDSIKLVKALSTKLPEKSEGGQDARTVVLVGGGFVCMEVAGAIATHYPDVHPVLLVGGPHIIPSVFSRDLARFYEDKLVEAGVVIHRNIRAERLWGLEEQGEFETLGGERVIFGPAPRGFTDCRGVVVRNKAGRTVHVPGRVVVVGIGVVPNTKLFRDSLKLSEDGGIVVDPTCRVVSSTRDTTGSRGVGEGGARSVISRPVFAAGDVATFPLALEGSKLVRCEHVQNARDMAVVAARNMVGAIKAATSNDLEGDEEFVYHPVPCFYSQMLNLSWMFFGVASGEVVVLGKEDFETTRTLGAFWVRGERVVGAFLEGGTAEQQAALAQVARLRPKVFTAKTLKETSLGDFLEVFVFWLGWKMGIRGRICENSTSSLTRKVSGCLDLTVGGNEGKGPAYHSPITVVLQVVPNALRCFKFNGVLYGTISHSLAGT
ncbi:unnamed protein product [Discosporangium mesarthrocarpum]